MAACQPGPSIVLHMKKADDVSLASSESSGCSSEASSPSSTRSPPSDPRQEMAILQDSRDSSLRPRDTSTDRPVTSTSNASSPAPQGILRPSQSRYPGHQLPFSCKSAPMTTRCPIMSAIDGDPSVNLVLRDQNSLLSPWEVTEGGINRFVLTEQLRWS